MVGRVGVDGSAGEDVVVQGDGGEIVGAAVILPRRPPPNRLPGLRLKMLRLADTPLGQE
ncbi:MAG: hypothetical protein QM729_05890 [Solirubrobacterales bacterium]